MTPHILLASKVVTGSNDCWQCLHTILWALVIFPVAKCCIDCCCSQMGKWESSLNWIPSNFRCKHALWRQSFELIPQEEGTTPDNYSLQQDLKICQYFIPRCKLQSAKHVWLSCSKVNSPCVHQHRRRTWGAWEIRAVRSYRGSGEPILGPPLSLASFLRALSSGWFIESTKMFTGGHARQGDRLGRQQER